MALPAKGPIAPMRMKKSENAPAVVERLQRNSLRRATKKIEKDWKIVEVRPRMMKLTPRMTHL